MSTRYVVVDRDTPMLLPPRLQDWLPEGHLVHFMLETVGLLPLHGFQVNTRGTGSAQYPPSMLLSLLIYNYSIGRMSSRQIEKATYDDVASRYICGGHTHPDHDTICAFRRQNADLFQECFVKGLEYAREMRVLAKRGGISVDGTKIGANASKHAAVSHGRATDMIAELEGEVQTLMALAEQADRDARPETLKIPEEIARREKRLAKLKQAKAVIEERCQRYAWQKNRATTRPRKPNARRVGRAGNVWEETSRSRRLPRQRRRTSTTSPIPKAGS